MTANVVSPAYRHLLERLADERCVILDGGIATELERRKPKGYRIADQNLWGTWALYHAPYAVLDVHRAYVATGCDVISTDTWGLVSARETELVDWSSKFQRQSLFDVARLGVRLAFQAIEEAGRTGECAVAFAINGDVTRPEQIDVLRLLTEAWAEAPPDLILMETMSLIRDGLTRPAVEVMLSTGLPVWLGFRRCRYGVCGIHGQHWGGPEGDLFGQAARDFEAAGVGALLVNCLPADHVPGFISWLRNFTSLPLGVYPNLGRYLDPGWKFEERIGPAEYADLAEGWRSEGARIVGGCCGVTPEHIAAARARLADLPPGQARIVADHDSAISLLDVPAGHDTTSHPWLDDRGRTLYPLPYPDLVVDPGVFKPTQGTYLTWKHLFRTGVGSGQRCLDVGCGTGVLAIQLALNGAVEVDAIDVQREAVANTMANAFRNGVADRVHAAVIDLYALQPTRRFDVVVASLFQMPVDPLRETSSHRPVDFWGRNLLDHLIGLLPDLLTDDGVAFVLQISLLGQLRTAERLDRAGLTCRVVDFSFFPFSPAFRENIDQIRRVEQLSDAYHFTFGDEDVMVMYLLEIRRHDRAAPASTD